MISSPVKLKKDRQRDKWCYCASRFNRPPWPKVGQKKVDLLILHVDFTILQNLIDFTEFDRFYKIWSILSKIRSIFSKSHPKSPEIFVRPYQISRNNLCPSVHFLKFPKIHVPSVHFWVPKIWVDFRSIKSKVSL